MKKYVIGLAVLGVAAASIAAARPFFSPTAAQAQGATAHPNTSDKPFFGTSMTSLGESVDLDLNVSLLPLVTLADGSVVRPMSMRGIFELAGGHYLGESRRHLLCPSGSTEAIDLSSAQELDLSLFDPAPNEPKLRTYDVRVRPAPGKTWGQVLSMQDDVRVDAHLR